MKGVLFFILFSIGLMLMACSDTEQTYVYDGKVDSASIGLTRHDQFKTDSILKADSDKLELPQGLIIDTGQNNPFAEDTMYINFPKKKTALRDDR